MPRCGYRCGYVELPGRLDEFVKIMAAVASFGMDMKVALYIMHFDKIRQSTLDGRFDLA